MQKEEIEMMEGRVPDTQALQFAYASVPVILILLSILIQNIRQGKKRLLLLTAILAQLNAIRKPDRECGYTSFPLTLSTRTSRKQLRFKEITAIK